MSKQSGPVCEKRISKSKSHNEKFGTVPGARYSEVGRVFQSVKSRTVKEKEALQLAFIRKEACSFLDSTILHNEIPYREVNVRLRGTESPSRIKMKVETFEVRIAQ